jgi:IS5 family transposase
MSKRKYKSLGKTSMFDEVTRIEKLSQRGNRLEKLEKVIDFEIFRSILEESMLNHNTKSNAGNRPYDVVLMFKIILLKRLYGLSDDEAEYQILDRLSFREFLGLSSGDKVPDAKSIWLFQDKLVKKNLEEELFFMFNDHLKSLNLLVKEGKIVDASFVEVPRQRNKRDENECIKGGGGSNLWLDNPHKKSQKDIDARWTKKGDATFYGYKNHCKANSKSKLIETYKVTDASVHDSQVILDLISENDKKMKVYADSAYVGKEIKKSLKEKCVKPQIIERAHKNKPLSEGQKTGNCKRSKKRCRIEHIFGFITNSLDGFRIRSVGFQRAKGIIGLTNLLYNICRLEQIIRLNILPVPKSMLSRN